MGNDDDCISYSAVWSYLAGQKIWIAFKLCANRKELLIFNHLFINWLRNDESEGKDHHSMVCFLFREGGNAPEVAWGLLKTHGNEASSETPVDY